ncbi:uncharacterized protein [Triticum aestivum]|uniref:uncharacterized protein isoform X2 n=1 Tax=Triticum aestivum TaxID=4565 RepID=UPI001D02C67C|nr:uncharacterized protein LOC123097255 isoform X2 [Triticum aestivum]
MEKGNPAEAPAARDPNGKGRATTASQAETTEPRVPSRAGDSVGGPLDWEEIKATSRRILRRSPNRNRCWKWMKRRAEEMMRTNLARIPTDLAGSGKAGGYNDNKLEGSMYLIFAAEIQFFLSEVRLHCLEFYKERMFHSSLDLFGGMEQTIWEKIVIQKWHG